MAWHHPPSSEQAAVHRSLRQQDQLTGVSKKEYSTIFFSYMENKILLWFIRNAWIPSIAPQIQRKVKVVWRDGRVAFVI
jgi:hypothetical protein